jgi:tetratricopeptide (TPR) repeat protein
MDERMHDATEESCVLSGFLEDHGQVSTVVSYAQTTASWPANSQKESDRVACLLQAKAILDLHKDFMDSPQVALGRKRTSPNTIASEQPLINEDGLAPLGGTWPESSTHDRITPEVLEHPEQHLHTIQQCSANYMKRARFGEALHLLEMILDCQRAKNGPLHEDVGSALHNVGIAYMRMEHHYEAMQAFEEAVRVRKGALGRDHPQVAVSLVKVGIVLLLLKRYEDSLWIFREALTVRKHALGNLHPSTARIYNNIGCVHVEFHELKEARRAFEAALDIQRNALVHDPESGPILFGAATTLQNLGYLYRKRDMQEKAAVVLREALSVSVCIVCFYCVTKTKSHKSLICSCSFKKKCWVRTIPP